MKLTEDKLAIIHDFLTRLGYVKVTDIPYTAGLDRTVKTNCPTYFSTLFGQETTRFFYDIANFPVIGNDIYILEYFYINYVGKDSPDNCFPASSYVHLKYKGIRTVDNEEVESLIFSHKIAYGYEGDEYVNFCDETQPGDDSCSPANKRKHWSFNIILLMPNDSGFVKFDQFPILVVGRGVYNKLKLEVEFKVEVVPQQFGTWHVRQIFGFERLIVYRLDPMAQITSLSLLLSILSLLRI